MSVKAGDMTDLSCAAQGYPIPEYTWFIKSPVGKLIKVQASRRIAIKGGLMRFLETTKDDSNTYECLVNNSVGIARREMILTVTEPLNVKIEPLLQVVDVGKSSMLKCKVKGYPINYVTWIKDMQHLFDDGGRVKLTSRDELHITSVQREDKGMYQCFASNGFETAQGSAQLILGDAAPVLLETFQERILQPGPSISLKCVASGSPIPEIKWTLDGVDLPKHDRIQVGDYIFARNGDVTSHVNISNIKPKDGGYYQCTVTNKIGSVYSGARLNVFGVPFIRQMNNRSVISGQTLIIQCPVSGYPIKKIYWQRGGKNLPLNHAQKVFPNGTLMVRNVQPDDDAGQYTCIAGNKHHQSSRRTVNVKVFVPPVIDKLSFPNKLNLVNNRRMSIHCAVIMGDPPISIAWHKDGELIEPDIDVTLRNFDMESTMIIRSVSLKHNGTYTCIANNSAATVSRTAVVIVNVPPSWKVEPQDTSVALGSTSFLDCMAKGSPKPQITWRKAIGQDFDTIYNMHPFHIYENGTLAVKNITENLGGKYLCQASNEVGKSVSKVINIDVRIPAYVLVKEVNKTVKLDYDVLLKCEGFGDTPVSVTWMRDSEPLDVKSRKRYEIRQEKTEKSTISSLAVLRTERKDSATFTCQVSNTFGSDEMMVNLIVLEPPESVRSLSAKVVKSREVEIAWKHPFDGNSPITKYIIQYKNQSRGWNDGQVPYQTLMGSLNSIKLKHLRPAAKYDARLITENEEGTSMPSKVVKFTTADDNPEGSPENVSLKVMGTRTLKVYWTPPEKPTWNGKLKGYSVGYRLADSGESFNFRKISNNGLEMEDKKYTFLISGLNKQTEYEVVLQAYNSAGPGPNSVSVYAKTLAEGDGLFPPNQPRIKVISTRHLSIELSWNIELTEDRPVRHYMLHYTWDRVNYKTRTLTARRFPNMTVIVDGLICGTNYTFNLTASNGKGEGEPSNTLRTATNGIPPRAPDKDKFIISNKTFVVLDMSSWDDGGCPMLSLIIKYKLRKHKIWTESMRDLNPRRDLIAYVKALRPHTEYRIKVIAENDAGVTTAEYNVKTTGTGTRSSAADLFSGDMTFVFSAIGLIALIVIVLIIVSVCLCLRKKKPQTEKNHVRKAVNGNNNNKKKVELPDVPGPVKKNNNQQQNNRSHSPQRQTSTVTYENTSNLIYCPKNEELMPYAKMVLGAKMEDSGDGSNGQVEFKTFYMKAGARRTDPPPLPPRDDSLAMKVATLRRNPRPPGSHRYPGNGSEETGDESDIYRDPEDSELPPPLSSLPRQQQNNSSNKQSAVGFGSLSNKAQNHRNILSNGTLNKDGTLEPPPPPPPNDLSGGGTSTSGYYSNTPMSMNQTGVYTNFPPPPPNVLDTDPDKPGSYYSNSSIIAQHQANLLGNPHYQMITKKPRRFVPEMSNTNSFRRASEDLMNGLSLKNPPPPSQLRASSNTLSSSDEMDRESKDHIATRLHKEILGAKASAKQTIPQSVV